jgi:predicted RNase H-like nuclease (RuvC/YqgF family)
MSEIAERIQFNARRSAEYCDGVVLSDANIDQIIQAETGYEKEIDALRSRIAELEHKLASYQAAADGDTHLCAECKMKDERIAELEKRATRLAQEYCELAEVWQKHECNPAPPEDVSNET